MADGDAVQGRRSRAGVMALVAVLIGVIFVLRTTAAVDLGPHWWALLFLAAPIYLFDYAWARYQAGGGKVTTAIVNTVSTGLVIVAFAIILWLQIPWGRTWPMFVVIAGIAAFLNARRRP